MTEEALRAWARDHSMLVDSAVVAVVVLAFAVRAAWWLRKNSLQDAKAALLAPAPVHAPAPAAQPLNPGTMRNIAAVLGILGVVALGLAAWFSWDEYQWFGAEVVRAPFIDSFNARGTATGRYRVPSTTRPPFIAIFTSTPRGGIKPGVVDGMKVERRVEVHSGEPLRYREYERATAGSRSARGWPAIELYLGLGGLFGALFLLFAFKLRAQGYA